MDNQPTISTPTPASPPTSNLLNPLTWSRKQKIAALVLSLLLPPLGLLFLVYMLLRAIKTPAWRGKLAFLLVAAVFTASLLGAYGYLRVYHSWRTGQQYHYSYSKLDGFKLPSALENSAISFQKPVEFIQSGKSATQEGSSISVFYQPNLATQPKSGLAYLSVSSVQSALAATPLYVSELSKTLSSPSNSNYPAMVKPVKDFLAEATDSVFKIDLGKAKTLRTGNIKNNAWQFDFSVQNDKNKTKITPLKGRVIMVIGKNTFYYFMVSTLDYNWQPNQTVWQQVIDSIKIDQ